MKRTISQKAGSRGNIREIRGADLETKGKAFWDKLQKLIESTHQKLAMDHAESDEERQMLIDARRLKAECKRASKKSDDQFHRVFSLLGRLRDTPGKSKRLEQTIERAKKRQKVLERRYHDIRDRQLEIDRRLTLIQQARLLEMAGAFRKKPRTAVGR